MEKYTVKWHYQGVGYVFMAEKCLAKEEEIVLVIYKIWIDDLSTS